MGQAVGVHAEVALDARDLLAAVIALAFRCVCILDALRVNDEEGGFLVPPTVFPDCANHLFLAPLPDGSVRSPLARSISENSHNMSATGESLGSAFATGNRF